MTNYFFKINKKKNLISQQHSANISCKTFLFSDAFRPTAVDFFKEVYKLILQACIYKPQLAAITGTNDHIGWAGLTN